MDKPVSRRTFLVRTAVPTAVAASGLARLPAEAAGPPSATGPGPVALSLKVNASDHALSIEPRVTLLDALRERLNLIGTKKGCDQGTCGACTVLVNGRRIKSCLTLAIMHQRDRITTIEGLASGDRLHPMQAAFLQYDGFQCGYCTPGQIVSAVGFLGEQRATDPANVREFMSGNICRCGAYPNIVDAIVAVSKGAGNAPV